MMKRIIFLTLIMFTMLYSNTNSLMLKVSFQDETPYQTGFWFFSKDHFRIKIELKNLSDSTFAVEKITPSGDNGNPKLMLKQKNSKEEVNRNRPVAYDYLFNDSFFIDLKPGQVYKDSIDFEDLYDI